MKKQFMIHRFNSENSKVALSKSDEGMWDEVRQSLREQFPNPQRKGCPDSAVLKRLALGTMRLAEAEVWLDHFSYCSPCFCEFEHLQQRNKQRRRQTWAVAAAAVIILCSSVILWLKFSSAKETQAHAQPIAPATLAQTEPAQLPAVVLHLENPSTVRGTEGHSALPVQHLPRKPLSLSIYLPPDDRSRFYEIQFFRHLSDTVPLARFAGNSEIEKGQAILRITADLTSLEPGDYLIAFRRAGSQWRYSHVEVS